MSHMTLVHGLTTVFNLNVEQRGLLTQLVHLVIDFDRPIRWTLRLYSREQPTLAEVNLISI